MKFIIKAGTHILQFLYQSMKVFPVRNKVTMISRQSNKPSIDFQLLKEEIEKREDNIEVIILCKTLEGGEEASFFQKLEYGLHMIVQMYHMATSKVIVLDTYCIVASLLHHRKSLKIIQLWHSMGTMKLFGYTALGSEEGSSVRLAETMHMHENYDYFVAASENYSEHLARGFRCDKRRAFICPLPRYDLLKSASYKAQKRREIFNKYKGLQNGKNILYCPTFRRDEARMEEAVQQLIRSLPHGFNLIVKLHPLSKIKVSGLHVWCLKEFSTFESLFVADYIISDYSCVIYEAGILELPLCFYIFDFKEYIGKRGFAISFQDEVKGVIAQEAEPIMEAIENNRFDMQEIRSFIGKYVTETDSATRKLTEFIVHIGGLKNE